MRRGGFVCSAVLWAAGCVGISHAVAGPVSWLPDSNGNWEVAGNWSPGLPTATDDVTIDVGGATVRTITIGSGNQSARSLLSQENLTLSGGSLTIGSGGATVNGAFNITNNRTLTVDAGTFTATGATNVDGAAMLARSGATIMLPGVTSYAGDSPSESPGIEARGAGSVINLPNLTMLTGNTFSGRPALEIIAAGGNVKLASVTSIASDATHVNAFGAGAEVDLSSLANFTGGPNSYVVADSGGTVKLRANGITSVTDVAVFLRPNGTISVGTLELKSTDVNGGDARTFSGLADAGTLYGSLLNTSGRIKPEHTINITGDFTQGAGGVMDMVIFNTLNDTLNVSGTATLGGTLNVIAPSDYVPAYGDTFVLLTAMSVGGEFDSLDLPTLGGGLYVEVDVTATQVIAQVVPEPAALGLIWGTATLLLRRARKR